MNLGLYSVYDKVAEEYGPVFQAVNDRVASRNFSQMLTNPNTPVNTEDFELYRLARFDTHTGSVTSDGIALITPVRGSKDREPVVNKMKKPGELEDFIA